MTDVTSQRKKGLSRWQAVPLAIGSIAGSGILFLPSAVYSQAGDGSLLVWGVSTLLCLPMLAMFDDMVRSNPDGRGIEAFIRMGLGDLFGRCVPMMFIAMVIVGLPAGAFVAGQYVANVLGVGRIATTMIAMLVLVSAVAANRAGARISAGVQMIATWSLVLVASILILSTVPFATDRLDAVVPNSGSLVGVLPGVLLAFWAFAGFENLTFLAREFRRPTEDFLPVSAIALIVYGTFTIGLTVAIAVTVPQVDIDPVVGLQQLAAASHLGWLLIWAVTMMACVVMLLNAIAWVWGVSQLVRDAAKIGMLPSRFSVMDQRGVPRRAMYLLAVLFSVTCVILALNPGLVIDATAAASSIFVLLYLLCIASYFRVRGVTTRSLLNLALLIVMVCALYQSGWQVAYSVVVLLSAIGFQLIRRRVTDSSPVPRCAEDRTPELHADDEDPRITATSSAVDTASASAAVTVEAPERDSERSRGLRVKRAESATSEREEGIPAAAAGHSDLCGEGSP